MGFEAASRPNRIEKSNKQPRPKGRGIEELEPKRFTPQAAGNMARRDSKTDTAREKPMKPSQAFVGVSAQEVPTLSLYASGRSSPHGFQAQLFKACRCYSWVLRYELRGAVAR
jgi:hypothetical protein